MKPEDMFAVEHLIGQVGKWASERKIYEFSTAQAQFLKLIAEAGELADNLAKGRDVRDDIGDCLVCLINIANLSDTSIKECLNLAWDDIKDRKGSMSAGGVFVKESDNG